jgi:tryptophan halogenase
MNNTEEQIKKIVIVGGGTAGWIAAATIGNIFKDSDVELELVESEDIGIIGVGEATVPPLLKILESLGIDLVDFIKETQATFKWGIQFEDWHTVGQSFFHPFGTIGKQIDGHDFYHCWLKSKTEGDKTPLMAHSPGAVLAEKGKFYLPFEAQNTPLETASYALHLDAALVGKYLRKFAENVGVTRSEGFVEHVNKDEDGAIKSITLKSGQNIEGDFFIDCSGFKGLLIEGALETGYDDWSEYLPCNRAVTVQTKNSSATRSYTIAKAREAGWTWQIPLQHRTGNGYVFCDKYISDQQAIDTLLASVEGEVIATPRIIPFTTGIRKKAWNKNCIALGLAQGFLEPLESTAIHLVSKTISLFVDMFPTKDCNPVLQNEFNKRVREHYEDIRDIIVLHYCTTEREDSEFWRWCKNMKIPESLNHRINFFNVSGGLILNGDELFQSTSWYAICNGMGLVPKTYTPTIDALNYEKLQLSMDNGQKAIEAAAAKQPSHDDFLQKFCPAPMLK